MKNEERRTTIRAQAALAAGFSFLILTSAAAQVKLEPAGALQDPSAAPAIVKAVAPQGERVLLANGNPLCEIWLVSSAPERPAQDTEHTPYSGAFRPGAFLGVIRFPQRGRDFRGQPIKAGAYTLRYQTMPNDGNHMGVAPQRDFLLLLPLTRDTQTATISSAGLLNASASVSGTPHPAVFMLLPAQKGDLPRVYESPEGYVVFAGQAGSVPLALVVKGEAEQ